MYFKAILKGERNEKYGFLVLACIFVVIVLIYAIYLLIKDFNANLKSNRLLSTTIFVVLFSVLGTYLTALLFKRFDIIEQVGSADAWIGFAGAGMGGLITMLALYFTLKQNQEMNQNSQISSLKPYVSCNITNLDSNERKILIKNYIENYDFIECKMRNISNNIANGIKIVDEYSSVETENEGFKRYDDLLEEYGISIYTTSLNDGTFLAPQDEYNWKTNFCIELNENGEYKWNDVAFAFKHTIVFQFTDVANLQTYLHRFEFEININVDVNNDLHFFLWNISNSIDVVDIKSK